jgi:hypothetical protein
MNAMPLSAGTFLKKISKASSPPAEAPIPMMGKPDFATTGFAVAVLFLAARAFGAAAFAFVVVVFSVRFFCAAMINDTGIRP